MVKLQSLRAALSKNKLCTVCHFKVGFVLPYFSVFVDLVHLIVFYVYVVKLRTYCLSFLV